MTIPCEGGCLCGVVRYRIHGQPLTLYACHCTDCQRQSGSAFGMSLLVLREHLELLQGTPATFTSTSDAGAAEGHKKHGRFCSSCGSRVWNEPTRAPQVLVVKAGTLDDTKSLVPVGHIWTRSAQPWVRFADDALLYPGQPADMSALLQAWQARAAQQ